MECFKEGEWIILHQMNNRRLARISRKGFTLLGRDSVSLEGVIGCLPWTNFKMISLQGSKGGKRCFTLEPIGEDTMSSDDEEASSVDVEDKDNRTINDDGQSQSLSSMEIEALRDGGLTGKEIVNQLVAGSATYDKKTRYSQKKYLLKKENKHCLRERVSIRKTSLSSITEVLCGGGGGEGSRGSITGMRPDTLSQMLTALNIQWNKTCSMKSMTNADHNCETPDRANSQGTTYIVYESSSWGLLVASLLNYLPVLGCRLLHLYPGHGVPTLIAPRSLNFSDEKLSILSSVNLKALLQKLGKFSNLNVFPESEVEDDNVDKVVDPDIDCSTEGNDCNISVAEDKCKEAENNERIELCEQYCDKETKCDDLVKTDNNKESVKSSKRKLENSGECTDGETVEKKPRWEQEAEKAADLLNSCKADGLVVVASKEHPVSVVLALLPYLAPSRPLVVYCPYREPLLELYAVLKGMEPWVGRYKLFGTKESLPKMVNLRVTENWLRNYQVLSDRTHPEVNMSPGGGFLLTGTLVDQNDQ